MIPWAIPATSLMIEHLALDSCRIESVPTIARVMMDVSMMILLFGR